MPRLLSLDSGHLTDEELGIDRKMKAQMCERPISNNERTALRMTKNHNLVRPR